MSRLWDAYARLPVPLQNLAVTLKGLDFRWRRESTRIRLRTLAFLLESQHWSADEMEGYRVQRLEEILDWAVTHIPYYRDRPVYRRALEAGIRSSADVRRLPFLTKDQVREHRDELMNPRAAGLFSTEIFTSGTTGTPLRLLESRRSFSERFAFVDRLRHWAGISETRFPRRVQFTGRDVVPDDTVREGGVCWRRNWAGNALVCSTTHIDKVTAAGYLSAMCRFEPELVDGYPSALTALARIGLARGLEFPHPQALIVTAETLIPADRECLEDAFGCRVFDQYAASEPSCFWSDCEFGSLHMHPEYGVSEIVDAGGQPVDSGEEGTVVVTSFLNRAMPLLRYRIGDQAVAGDERPCPCGRAMPKVTRVVGREDDVLYIPGRGWVGRLDPIFKGVDGVIEAQIVQTQPQEVSLRVVLTSDGDWSRICRTLTDNVRRKVGPDTEIRVEQADRLPRGPNGKLRAVVGHPDAQPKI